ncbi:MAG: outer membrane beta-barrel protein [Agriterribacter sp.]
MPESNFEKQVQQMFEGLKFKPSDNVWQNVEERIKKDKRDRKFIFWIPTATLLLLLVGAGAYLKWGSRNEEHKATVQHAVETSVPGISNQDARKDALPGKEGIAKSATRLKQPQIPGTVSPGVVIKENREIRKNHTAINNKNRNNKEGSKSVSITKPSTVKDNEQNGNAQQMSLSPVKDETPCKNVQEDYATTPREFSGETMQQHVPLNNFVLSAPEAEMKLVTINSNLTAGGAASTPVKLSKNKLWEFGFTASANISKVGSGLSGIFSRYNIVEKTVLPNALSVNNTTASFVASQNNNYLAALPSSPSAVKPGFSWSVGVSAKWYIKARFALSGAVQYTRYTTSRNVGNILNNNSGTDISARYAGVYSNAGNTAYTNRYHFIEAPVGIQWQLNKAVKMLPVHFNAGISIGWLMNTNAVHYDKTTGSYYQDEYLFNKVQAGLYAGISAKLFQHSYRPLYIGPFVQYGFSNLLKSSAGERQNLVMAGIKAEWTLWKK